MRRLSFTRVWLPAVCAFLVALVLLAWLVVWHREGAHTWQAGSDDRFALRKDIPSDDPFQRGFALEVKGKLEEARQVYESALAADPARLDIRYRLGDVNLRLRDLPAVIRVVEPMASSDDIVYAIGARCLMAQAYSAMGRSGDALRCLEWIADDSHRWSVLMSPDAAERLPENELEAENYLRKLRRNPYRWPGR